MYNKDNSLPIAASVLTILIMHITYRLGLYSLFQLLFFLILSFFMVCLPLEKAFIVLFIFSFHGEGFQLYGTLMIAYLVILFTGSLLFKSMIKRKNISGKAIIFVFILIGINCIQLNTMSLSDFIRIICWFLLVVFVASDKDISLSEYDQIVLTRYTVISLTILAVFSFLAGQDAYGSAYYSSLIGSFRLGEAYRDFGGADSLGYALCLAYPLAIKDYLDKKENRLIPTLYLLILFIIGIMAKTRSFLLAGLIITVLFLLYLFRAEKKKQLYIIIGVLLLCFVAAQIYTNSPIVKSAFDRFSYNDITHGRTNIYKRIIELSTSSINTFIFGVGFTYKEKIGILAHNIPLEIIVSWGIIGAIAFIALIISLYEYGKYRLFKDSALFYWIGFGLACLTICSITYDHFYIHLCMLFVLATKGVRRNEQ